MGSSEAFLPRFRKSNGNASVAGIAYSLSRALLEAHQGSLDDRGAFRVLPQILDLFQAVVHGSAAVAGICSRVLTSI